MKEKRALITGLTGQDGAYLASHLHELGYEVHGMVRRSSSRGSLWRLRAVMGEDDASKINVHEGDLTDQHSIDSVVRSIRPTHVFNLGAQSFVGASFTQPDYTMQVTGYGAVRVMESCLRHAAPGVRMYQASSSEMFGRSPSPQSEDTAMHPCSPYGCAKLYAHTMADVYRRGYGLHVSCGILFNHESPIRGDEFVTQSVAKQVAECFHGRSNVINVGNLGARRDWGYAGDYVKAMVLMAESEIPRDYVIATGASHTVLDFVNECIKAARNMAGEKETENLRSININVDPARVSARPVEVPDLLGCPIRAIQDLGWTPHVGFHDLVRMMTRSAIYGLYGDET